MYSVRIFISLLYSLSIHPITLVLCVLCVNSVSTHSIFNFLFLFDLIYFAIGVLARVHYPGTWIIQVLLMLQGLLVGRYFWTTTPSAFVRSRWLVNRASQGMSITAPSHFEGSLVDPFVG